MSDSRCTECQRQRIAYWLHSAHAGLVAAASALGQIDPAGEEWPELVRKIKAADDYTQWAIREVENGTVGV